MICSAGYSASSGLPRTLGPNAAMVMMTIAAVIRPNTPPTPASRYVVRSADFGCAHDALPGFSFPGAPDALLRCRARFYRRLP
jgi:hypothetical protein